ncbi:MAG: phage tail tube protein [Candidatus Korobacteraceae bacterium]
MSNTPYVGIGDSFEFATVASPTVFTTLDGVQNVAISGDKVATEKTTTMATTNGVDTFISSTQDPGTCDVKGLFYPGDTSQVALEAIRLAGQPVAMKVLYGSSNSCAFTGIVESLTPAFPLEKPASLDIKIRITGPKVYV